MQYYALLWLFKSKKQGWRLECFINHTSYRKWSACFHRFTHTSANLGFQGILSSHQCDSLHVLVSQLAELICQLSCGGNETCCVCTSSGLEHTLCREGSLAPLSTCALWKIVVTAWNVIFGRKCSSEYELLLATLFLSDLDLSKSRYLYLTPRGLMPYVRWQSGDTGVPALGAQPSN